MDAEVEYYPATPVEGWPEPAYLTTLSGEEVVYWVEVNFPSPRRPLSLLANDERTREVIEALQHLTGLPEDWDSHGASPVGKAVVEGAWALVLYILGRRGPLPDIVPTSNGGINLEWHAPRTDVQIEISADGRMALYFSDEGAEVEWEEEEVGSWWQRLDGALEMISFRERQRS